MAEAESPFGNVKLGGANPEVSQDTVKQLSLGIKIGEVAWPEGDPMAEFCEVGAGGFDVKPFAVGQRFAELACYFIDTHRSRPQTLVPGDRDAIRQRVTERIVFRTAEAKMQMPPPALCVLITS